MVGGGGCREKSGDRGLAATLGKEVRVVVCELGQRRPWEPVTEGSLPWPSVCVACPWDSANLVRTWFSAFERQPWEKEPQEKGAEEEATAGNWAGRGTTGGLGTNASFLCAFGVRAW